MKEEVRAGEREIRVIERDRRGRRWELRLVEGLLIWLGWFFIATEECNVPVGHIKTQGHSVRVVSEAAGPWWKHENGVIASLPV